MKHSVYDDMISAKYESKLDYPITMYDNLPYQRDSDYCNAEKLTLQSGKIIKYYLCLNQTEQYAIDNRDDEIEQILATIQAEERKRIEVVQPEPKAPDHGDGITPEQIQTLLEDQEEDAPEPPEPAPDTVINAFEGVEDW